MPQANQQTTEVEVLTHSAPLPAPLAPARNPMELLMLAIMQGADISVLRELEAMNERFEAKAAERAFHAALSGAQGDFPAIEKTRDVEHKYKYASLDDLMAQITPVLKRYELSTSFERSFVSGEDGLVKSVSSALVVRHADGHKHTFPPVVMPVERMTSRQGNYTISAAQAIGVAMTYADRYAYQGGLGFRPCDEDTDGKAKAAANGNGQAAQAASTAPVEAQPMAALELPAGWRQVYALAISIKPTSRGGSSCSIKVSNDANVPWPSTFKAAEQTMLQQAHDRKAPILIHCRKNEKNPRFVDILAVQWPDAYAQEARRKHEDGPDNPENYAQPAPAARPNGAAPLGDDELPY